LNTQLAGNDYAQKSQAFMAYAERWRMTYMSVTCYQDGPDLANQGTLVACQAPVSCFIVNPTSLNSVGPFYQAFAHVGGYTASDVPQFDNMQSMPNAYFNRSREGCYMPLKLTETCQQWMTAADCLFPTFGVMPDTWESAGVYYIPATNVKAQYPHFGANPLYIDPVTGQGAGDLIPPMANGLFGMLAARNCAVTTSFTFFIRAGYEIQVKPGTMYTTHLKLSPPYDALALDTYFAISRELKDAYPSDYNDLGKIWDNISSVLRMVSPLLKGVPGFGNLLSAGAKGIAMGGDMIKQIVTSKKMAKSKQGRGDQPSQAVKERAQETKTAQRAVAAQKGGKAGQQRVRKGGKKGK